MISLVQQALHRLDLAGYVYISLRSNFNFALIDGCRDLNNPDCDYVVTLQNDALLHPNWCHCITTQFKNFDFIVGYLGDNIVGYTPEIVKSVASS